MSAESDRPDLMVPIDVAALAVGEGGPGWAEHRPSFGMLKRNQVLGQQIEPGLFQSNQNLHPRGVHLHWALPDGLCHGQSPRPDSEPVFPLIPNRWLVVRLQRPDGSAAPVCRAWVVESDSISDDKQGQPWPGEKLDNPDTKRADSYVRYVGRVTELRRWKENQPARIDITALGYGDPAFAASYVASRRILGFHDELSDLTAAAELDYFVAGWYSDPGLDPLSAALEHQAKSNPYETVEALGRFLDERRWVYQGQEGYAGALAQAQASSQSLRDACAAQKRLKQLNAAEANAEDPFADADTREGERSKALEALELTIADLDSKVKADKAKLADLASRLPGRILCHGTITGVQWRGASAGVEDCVPLGEPFRVALGENAVEAFGALLNGLQPDLVSLLEAFQHGFLADFAAPGGFETIKRKLHEQTFRPQTLGLRWGIRNPMAGAAPESPDDRSPPIPGDIRDLLEELNRQQAEIDRIKRERDAVKHELYSTWYRWVAAGKQQNKAALEQRRDDLLADVELLDGALGKLEDGGTDRPRGELWHRLRAAIDTLLPGFVLEAVDDQRFWRPRDPVLLLAGKAFKASPRHGQDGRWRADGRLACRLSGEEVTMVRVAASPGADPGADGAMMLGPSDLDLACPADLIAALAEGLPIGIAALFHECQLLTVSAPGAGDGGDAAAIRAKLPAHLQRLWREVRDPERQGEIKTTCSATDRIQGKDWDLNGRFPSPVAYKRWTKDPNALEASPGNPWLPLFLQWQVEWIPASAQAATSLDGGQWDDLGTAYRWLKEQTPGEKQSYEGSALLTPSAAEGFSRQLRRGDLVRRFPGLDGLASEVAGMDLLCQSLSGFTDRLLMHRARWEPPPLDPASNAQSGPSRSTIAEAVAGIDRIAPLTDSSLLPVRAGRMRLKKLWVVDAFGQILKLPGDNPEAQNRLANPALPARLRDSGADMRLDPRLAQAARLVMDWPPARSDDSACGQEPIRGWVVPNLMDASLSIFDVRGNALGALQSVRHLSREAGAGARRVAVESFHWVDVPGSQRFSYGEAPREIREPLGPDADPGLQGFVTGLLSLEGAAGPAFGALLDAIDQAFGADGGASATLSAGLALLIGRPLALVRARLRLELDGPPALDQSLANVQSPNVQSPNVKSPGNGGIRSVKFPLRLGDRRAWNGTWLGDDGLVGYFLKGNYDRFYPAFGMTGRGDIGYLDFAHQPLISVDEPLELTLLLDPSRGVSVTSGILPRAQFALPYPDAGEVLEHKEVFFYTGPVVSPLGPLRIPEPSDIFGEWSWTHRSEVRVWTAPEAIVDLRNERACFGEDRMQMAEGWLRLVTAPLQIRAFEIRGLKPVAPPQDTPPRVGEGLSVGDSLQDSPIAEYEAVDGQELILSWAVTGADAIRLCRDGEELLQTDRHPLPTRCRLPSATKTLLLTLTATARATGEAPPEVRRAQVRVRAEQQALDQRGRANTSGD